MPQAPSPLAFQTQGASSPVLPSHLFSFTGEGVGAGETMSTSPVFASKPAVRQGARMPGSPPPAASGSLRLPSISDLHAVGGEGAATVPGQLLAGMDGPRLLSPRQGAQAGPAQVAWPLQALPGARVPLQQHSWGPAVLPVVSVLPKQVPSPSPASALGGATFGMVTAAGLQAVSVRPEPGSGGSRGMTMSTGNGVSSHALRDVEDDLDHGWREAASEAQQHQGISGPGQVSNWPVLCCITVSSFVMLCLGTVFGENNILTTSTHMTLHCSKGVTVCIREFMQI